MERSAQPLRRPHGPAADAPVLESRIAVILLAAIPIYTAWVWAGLRPSFHGLAVGMSAALLATLVLGGWRHGLRGIRRDPLFAAGLVFLGYLAIQWWNSGRALYFDVGLQQWTHTPPPHPGWPSGFDREETGQMIAWFLPAWAVALAVRSPLVPSSEVRRVLRANAHAAGLLAVLGAGFYLGGASSLYGVVPLSGPFFASFAYANHAGAYFVLAGAMAAGLLYREIFLPDRPGRRMRRIALALSAAACVVGANLSLSRAGVIMAWILVAVAAVYALARARESLSRVGRARYMAGVAGVVCALVLAVAGIADRAILGEFLPAREGAPTGGGSGVNLSLRGRATLREAAWGVWRESPWFGVGGWGFRHRAAFHVDPAGWDGLRRQGWANVHCDALQFLAEFGLVGAGLGLAALACVAVPLVQTWNGRSAFRVLGLLGLGLVVAGSLVDLPFRCPAILISWALLAAGIPRLSSVRSVPFLQGRPCEPTGAS